MRLTIWFEEDKIGVKETGVCRRPIGSISIRWDAAPAPCLANAYQMVYNTCLWSSKLDLYILQSFWKTTRAPSSLSWTNWFRKYIHNIIQKSFKPGYDRSVCSSPQTRIWWVWPRCIYSLNDRQSRRRWRSSQRNQAVACAWTLRKYPADGSDFDTFWLRDEGF